MREENPEKQSASALEAIRRSCDIGSMLEIIVFEGVEHDQDFPDQHPIFDPEGYIPSSGMSQNAGRRYVGYLLEFDMEKKRVYLTMGWDSKKKAPDYMAGIKFYHEDVIHSFKILEPYTTERGRRIVPTS